MDANALCEGIRDAVFLLQSEGFKTTDSGDGSHFKEGMDCAWEEPMVAIVEKNPNLLVERSHLLLEIFESRKLEVTVEASYNPCDGSALLVVYGEGLLNLSSTPEWGNRSTQQF